MGLPGDHMPSGDPCLQDGVSPRHCPWVCDGIGDAMAMCPPGRYIPQTCRDMSASVMAPWLCMSFRELCPQNEVSPWLCSLVHDGLMGATAMCPQGNHVPRTRCPCVLL